MFKLDLIKRRFENLQQEDAPRKEGKLQEGASTPAGEYMRLVQYLLRQNPPQAAESDPNARRPMGIQQKIFEVEPIAGSKLVNVKITDAKGKVSVLTPEIFLELIKVIPSTQVGSNLETTTNFRAQTRRTETYWNIAARWMGLTFVKDPQRAVEDVNNKSGTYGYSYLWKIMFSGMESHPQSKIVQKIQMQFEMSKPQSVSVLHDILKADRDLISFFNMEDVQDDGTSVLHNTQLAKLESANFDTIFGEPNIRKQARYIQNGGWLIVVANDWNTEMIFTGSTDNQHGAQTAADQTKGLNFTGWCTSQMNSKSTFERYRKSGPIYVLIRKFVEGQDKEHDNSYGYVRYQLGFKSSNPEDSYMSSDQTMDRRDHTITPQDLTSGPNPLPPAAIKAMWEYEFKYQNSVKGSRARIKVSPFLKELSPDAAAEYERPFETIEEALQYYGINDYTIDEEKKEITIIGDYTYQENAD